MQARKIAAIGGTDAGGDSGSTANDKAGCDRNSGKTNEQDDAGKADDETGNTLPRQAFQTPNLRDQH
ncbi:hypothetical protein D3C80_1870020 [compost metagenome]